MLKGRNSFKSDKLTLIKLEMEADFRAQEVGFFDCGDKDLNDFFRNDALAHKEQLLAETYVCIPSEIAGTEYETVIAMVSFCNDNIQITREERKGAKRRFFNRAIRKNIPYKKRYYKSFPAVKIARLGVARQYQNKGIGTEILNIVKEFFLTDNRTGCRFLTLDAYNRPEVIGFYLKNGFDFLWGQDKDESERIMYFDLFSYR